MVLIIHDITAAIAGLAYAWLLWLLLRWIGRLGQ